MTQSDQPTRGPAGNAMRKLATAMVLGASGGALFAWADLPLAWMLGAMAVCTIAAVAGVPLGVPGGLRQVNVAVLGVMLGSAFTPDLFDRLGSWTVSLAGLALYLLLTAPMVMFMYQRLGGYDAPTAFFSAIPGGLSEMILVGDSFGGDARRISLSHGTRILIVVMVLPFWFRFVEGVPAAPFTEDMSLFGMAAEDLAVLSVCGLLGYVAARAARLPAYALTGPMIISAAAHLAGLTTSRPPPELLSVAQVVVGSAIGARFAGVSFAELRRTVLLAIVATAIMLTMTVVMGLALRPIVGVDLAGLVLAYSPGGVAEMTLVALGLNIDVAFVSTHHLVRISLLVVVAPLIYRLLVAPRLKD